MFFTAEDDEQDFLSGGGGSKLASVFGMDRASSQGGNESLTYTAPKQPKKKDAGGGEAAAATAVTFATVVQAYKFVDNQYASQGKVGAAILANHVSHDYRILLYYNKQQQLTNAKISPAFSFNVQANNYANFYDDARINWSVMFNNAQDAERFAKEVGLAKALSVGGQPDGVVQQDLRLGEGGGLETGDSVEARYTGWLLTNNAFGQVFDSNISSGKLFRFKVGKGKVIKGWDTGMLGMKKGSKRLLVIPPSLAYGSQGMADRIPANATLIFEVEVVRVKLQKGDATPEPPAQPPSTVTAPVAVPSEEPAADHDETVKERTRSISEQLSHSPKTDKAKLISRMAKMGQPMLPNMAGAVPAQPDSEEEPPSPQPGTAKPHLAAKPHLTHPAQPAQPYPAQPGMQQQMHMAGQPMAAHPMAAQPMANQAMAQPYAQQMGQMINPAAMGGIQTLPTQSVPVSQPAFLQNLPGSQQLSLYQPQPTLLQQQQQAMLAMQQQQQQQQQQMAGLNMGQPTHLSDPMAPMLLSETRQQTTEVRLTVSKMSDKVDRILEKVEALSSVGAMQQQSLPAPTMETSILLHNISRIVQENERLKKDVFEKGDKIESQNEKIAELLQKNQRYVEKSNTLLEERNEGYKLTANQSQSRILALEQEKVQMATDLSNASSRLASLQLELGELRKTEGELRQRLQSTSSGSLEQKEELDRLRLQRAEDEKKLTDLTASLREEKAARKQTESQLTAIQEELADLKATNSTLERNVNERKRKAAEERKKMEEETEEIKAGFEQEIQTLREKLRKQRTSTDVETADKVAKMEEELAAEWQAKCDKMVAAAADKHARQLAAVKDDLRESQERVVSLEAKIQQLRSSTGSTDTKLADLQQQVEENAGFKEKYEHLRSQATAMKQKYEERIGELEEEAETMATRTRELQQQLVQSKQQLQQQQQQLQQSAAAPAPSGGGGGGADVATEVKKVMNSVFQSLRADFEASETYTGSEVLSAVLKVIKETTLKLVQSQTPTTGQTEEDDDDEEDEEEEEEEEEEEDEEEDEEDDDAEEEEDAQEKMVAAEVSQPLQAAQQKESEVKEVMASTTGHVTGDRGNPYYTRELDSTMVEEKMVSAKDHVTGDKGNPYYTKTLDATSRTGVEEPMMASAGHVTGDKGNPYYSKTLDATSGTGVEEPMTASAGHVTGDKGNPYYSRTLDATSKTSVEEPMTVSAGHVTGDKGNPYYSRTLDATSRPGVEEPMKVIAGHVTGDRGNPYYSKTLDATSRASVEEPMTASAGHVTGDKGNPYYSHTLDTTGVVEEKMVSAKDHVTGDKGNPYYSKTLDATSRTGVEEPMTASAGHVTGDRGNPCYSQTLDATGVVEEKMVLAKDHVTGDKGNPYYTKTLDAAGVVEEPMTASAGHVTGDRGNPYYSRTLDATGIVEDPLQATSGRPTGDRGNPYHTQTLDAGLPVEEAMVATSGCGTGGRGNPLYTQQLDAGLAESSHTEDSDTQKGDASPAAARPEETLSDASPAAALKPDEDSVKAAEATETPAPSKEEPVKEEASPPSSQPEAQPVATPSVPQQQQQQKPDSETDEEDSDLFLTPPQASQEQQKSTDSEKAADAANEPKAASAPVTETKKSEDDSGKRVGSFASDDGRSRTESGSVLPTLASREPPPLFDDEEDDESPLFGADDTVADTFGSHFKPPEKEQGKGDNKDKKQATAEKLPSKTELLGEDDLKPKPPPPLFGDDDDDEDLDWLN